MGASCEAEILEHLAGTHHGVSTKDLTNFADMNQTELLACMAEKLFF